MRNIVRITHFISFYGLHLPATAENYAADVVRYSAVAKRKIDQAFMSENSHDRKAYALQAGMYARQAAYCARRAQELGFRFPEIDSIESWDAAGSLTNFLRVPLPFHPPERIRVERFLCHLWKRNPDRPKCCVGGTLRRVDVHDPSQQ